jgi:hypothetical protein
LPSVAAAPMMPSRDSGTYPFMRSSISAWVKPLSTWTAFAQCPATM